MFCGTVAPCSMVEQGAPWSCLHWQVPHCTCLLLAHLQKQQQSLPICKWSTWLRFEIVRGMYFGSNAFLGLSTQLGGICTLGFLWRNPVSIPFDLWVFWCTPVELFSGLQVQSWQNKPRIAGPWQLNLVVPWWSFCWNASAFVFLLLSIWHPQNSWLWSLFPISCALSCFCKL